MIYYMSFFCNLIRIVSGFVVLAVYSLSWIVYIDWMSCPYLSMAYLVIVIVAGDTTYYFGVSIYCRVVYLAFCYYYGRGWGSVAGI
jgi:hypothetical protein